MNSTPLRAHRTCASGMHSGLTSPARPWFKLGTKDKTLNQRPDVRRWLDKVQQLMYAVFAGSNFYNSMHDIYYELSGFGTGAMLIEEDFEDIIRARTFTVGEYALGTGPDRRVDSLYRTIYLTARQAVRMFNPDMLRPALVDLARTKPEGYVHFYHAIEPNDDSVEIPGVGRKKYRDVYWDPVQESGTPDLIRVKGWEESPLMGPRWEVIGADVYGNGPGDMATPDAKMLMRQVDDKLVGLDRLVDPPLAIPGDMKSFGAANTLPGGATYFDSAAQQRPGALYQVNLPLDQLRQDIAETKDDIQKAFFVDLFMMLSMSDRREITAREVAEKHEEKLLQLGPVLDRLQTELHSPAIARAYAIMSRKTMPGGAPLIPPPPRSLEGMEIGIEYVSILAQAQKMVGATAIEQFAGFVGNIAGINKDILDKWDMDETVDQYGEIVGVPSAIIVPDADVAKKRAARQQAEAAAAAMEQSMAGAQAAKVLSQADMGGNNALTALMGGQV